MTNKLTALALTGGIASGKSTIVHIFSSLGVPVIDADDLSRQLVMPGSTLLKQIVDYFGEAYQDETGNLRRRALRERIFNFPADRLWLEKILHPAIYTAMKEKLNIINNTNHSSYAVCVIPLLFETGKPDFIERIILIDTEEQTQLTRLMHRDHLTQLQAENILKTQCSREERLQGADDIIKNNTENNAEYLHQAVLKLDNKYKNINK